MIWRMSEFVARDVLLMKVEESLKNNPHVNPVARSTHVQEHKHFMYLVSCAPSEDVAPVKRGKWITSDDPNQVSLVCSVCGQKMPYVPEYLPNRPPYCNCGAKMDGGRNETDRC